MLYHQSPAQRTLVVEDVYKLAVGLTFSACSSSQRAFGFSFGDGEKGEGITVFLRRYAHNFKPTYSFYLTVLLMLQENHRKSVTFELKKHVLHIIKQFPTINRNGNFGVLPLERKILIVLP